MCAPTGTLGEEAGQRALYCLDTAGTLHRRLPGVQLANGMAWTSHTMYFVDTAPRLVYALDFDLETGSIGRA